MKKRISLLGLCLLLCCSVLACLSSQPTEYRQKVEAYILQNQKIQKLQDSILIRTNKELSLCLEQKHECIEANAGLINSLINVCLVLVVFASFVLVFVLWNELVYICSFVWFAIQSVKNWFNGNF